MRGTVLLVIICLIPFIAALSHDLYIAYDTGVIEEGEEIKFFDLGILWTRYQPDTFNWAIETVDEDIWKSYISPVLKLRAIVATAIPPVVALIILFILKLFGIWPYRGEGWLQTKLVRGKKKSYESAGSKKAQYKYKRK